MKLILSAIAFAIATPAVAQSAPADPHAGHTAVASQAAQTGQAAPGAAEGGMGHSQHEGCCDKHADGKAMPCCEKPMGNSKKMACCDKGAVGQSSAPHAGHNMGQQ